MSQHTLTPVVSRPSTPSRDVSQPLQFVEKATNNYVTTGDKVICLRVNGHIFKVSKNRLTLRSPVFRDMFALPANKLSETKTPGPEVAPLEGKNVLPKLEHTDGEEELEVELHNDPEDFKQFLWYIHADPLAAHQFSEAENTPTKCFVLLGIASIAHMYEALDVANWAMRTVLNILMQTDRTFSVGAELAAHLLRTAARFQEPESWQFLDNARQVVCDAMHPSRAGQLSADPIAAVRAAQDSADDTYVLGHAYFYTLEKGNDYWREDARLRACDRRRLVCGGLLLLQRQLRHDYMNYGIISPTPQPAAEQVWDGGRYVWQNPVWEPLVRSKIRDCRNELWALFDCEPWRLVEEIGPSPEQ